MSGKRSKKMMKLANGTTMKGINRDSDSSMVTAGNMRCMSLEPDSKVAPGEEEEGTESDEEGIEEQNEPKRSKFMDMITCMFFRKKKKETEVVDMKDGEQEGPKNTKFKVDGSGRSRKAMKIEVKCHAPKPRDTVEHEPPAPPSPPGSKGMTFLPSENPAAVFLANMHPQSRAVRRACSDVVHTTSGSGQKPAREAFVNRGRLSRSMAIANAKAKDRNPWETANKERKEENDGKRSGLKKKIPDKTIVVPGIISTSEEDTAYCSDEEIHDLHDEIRRMNISHPDLKSILQDATTEEGGGQHNNTPVGDPDPNSDLHTEFKASRGKPNSVSEMLIDDLYMKTRQNINNIYKNGIDAFYDDSTQMTGCASRENTQFSEMVKAVSQETAKEIDRQENHANAILTMRGATNSNKTATNQNISPNDKKIESSKPELDSLLQEVSSWAKTRQNWLLGEPQNHNGEMMERSEIGDEAGERINTIQNSIIADNMSIQKQQKDMQRHGPWEYDSVLQSDGEGSSSVCSDSTVKELETQDDSWDSDSYQNDSYQNQLEDYRLLTRDSDISRLVPQPDSIIYTRYSSAQVRKRKNARDGTRICEFDGDNVENNDVNKEQNYVHGAMSPDTVDSTSVASSMSEACSELQLRSQKRPGFYRAIQLELVNSTESNVLRQSENRLQDPKGHCALIQQVSPVIPKLSPSSVARVQGLDPICTPALPIEKPSSQYKPLAANKLEPLNVLNENRQENIAKSQVPVEMKRVARQSSVRLDPINPRPLSDIPFRASELEAPVDGKNTYISGCTNKSGLKTSFRSTQADTRTGRPKSEVVGKEVEEFKVSYGRRFQNSTSVEIDAFEATGPKGTQFFMGNVTMSAGVLRQSSFNRDTQKDKPALLVPKPEVISKEQYSSFQQPVTKRKLTPVVTKNGIIGGLSKEQLENLKKRRNGLDLNWLLEEAAETEV